MGKQQYCIEISEILGIKEPREINGGTVEKKWIDSMHKAFPEDIELKENKKIRILHSIFKHLELEWLPEYNTDLKDEKGVDKGCTMLEPIPFEILKWLKENPEWINIRKEIILDNLIEIYELSSDFVGILDLDLDLALFDKFGSNYTWLYALKPIWKVLDISKSEINWDEDEEKLRTNIIEVLKLEDYHSKRQFFEGLSEHLETSFKFIKDFYQALEEDKTKDEAYRLWLDSWKELELDEDDVFDKPILAETGSWNINQFSKYAKEGRLIIDPWYQRPFVWSDNDTRTLINSIILGIPLPSVILHRTMRDGIESFEIIDGKQRITSILKFIGMHPTGEKFMKSKISNMRFGDEDMKEIPDSLFLNLILLDKSDFGDKYKNIKRFRKWRTDKHYGLITKKEKVDDARFLPIPFRKDEFSGELEKFNSKYYYEIREMYVQTPKSKVKVQEIFEELNDYRIPVIIYDKSTKPEQIRAVFNRYNTQGTKLNEQEVNNAAYHDLLAMKFVLAMTRVRPERGEEILPGIYSSIKSDTQKLESLFQSCGIKEGRYEWSKYLGFILGLLFNKLEKTKKGTLPTNLSTAAIIKSFWKSEKEDVRIKEKNCIIYSNLIGEAADSLHCDVLWELMIENPIFKEKKVGSHIWNDPSFYSFFIGAILCQASDININLAIEEDETYNKMVSFLKYLQPLGKTQAEGQWRYYAKVISQFCEIFGLTSKNFNDTNNLFDGYNLLDYLSKINALPALEDQ
ncbi:DUF262 domain-containing protein [Euryarchaeota archaeon]|nr:DUF262 domain-containing protein [Euryarchaeota archaeon]